MTEPRDPTDPTIDPSTGADPSATARMPLPGDPAPPDAPPATAWTPPPPAWTPAPVGAPESPPPSSSPAPPPTPPIDAAPPPAWSTPSPAPAWQPVRRSDDGRGPSVVFGLILLAIGLWFFAERTLGLDLPDLRWSQLWPLILIIVGVWVLFGARRRAR